MARPPILLLAWRNALASSEGPDHPHDRLVGLTCSLYMSRDGERCWPSQDTLAMRSGLTDRSVGRALQRLVDAKWLERQPRKSPRGIPHRRYGYEYRARFPIKLANAYWNGERRSLFTKGDDRGDPPRTRNPSPRRVNTERHDKRMANAVRTNSVEELAKSDAFNKEVSPQEVEDMRRAFGETT